MADRQLLLGILGPTASGKTAWSLALARALPLEIVCLDSMQVYRGMDIGTAKPTRAEQALAPHHMLDVRDPCQPYSVAEYASEAAEAIRGIAARGRLPLLVGGTGLYLRALTLPLTLGSAAADPQIRARYQALLAQEGPAHLHQLLSQVDPLSARRLHVNDSRRVIRALEVHALTGRPFSDQRMPQEAQSPYELLLYARDLPRALLYQRIERRVDGMLAAGLADEVKGLLAAGLDKGAQSMQGLGYKELVPYVRGEEGLESAAARLKQRTRQYAKRQLTWFRRDGRIRWLPGDTTEEAFIALVRRDVERA